MSSGSHRRACSFHAAAAPPGCLRFLTSTRPVIRHRRLLRSAPFASTIVSNVERDQEHQRGRGHDTTPPGCCRPSGSVRRLKSDSFVYRRACRLARLRRVCQYRAGVRWRKNSSQRCGIGERGCAWTSAKRYEPRARPSCFCVTKSIASSLPSGTRRRGLKAKTGSSLGTMPARTRPSNRPCGDGCIFELVASRARSFGRVCKRLETRSTRLWKTGATWGKLCEEAGATGLEPATPRNRSAEKESPAAVTKSHRHYTARGGTPRPSSARNGDRGRSRRSRASFYTRARARVRGVGTGATLT